MSELLSTFSKYSYTTYFRNPFLDHTSSNEAYNVGRQFGRSVDDEYEILPPSTSSQPSPASGDNLYEAI